MTTVMSIVEGDGEVSALPILLRRIGHWLSPEIYVDIKPPIRVKRDKFLNKEEEFRRMLILAADKCTDKGWILILLDADDDCPAELGKDILERAKHIIPYRRVSVVLANKEYEAWFIAGASSLDGRRGFNFQNKVVSEPENIRAAKEWLSSCNPEGKYREVTDQPAFSQIVDLELVAKNSRSFRKLCSEWKKNSSAVLEGESPRA